MTFRRLKMDSKVTRLKAENNDLDNMNCEKASGSEIVIEGCRVD
jgi:SOS-response transcriptional repressor LexA